MAQTDSENGFFDELIRKLKTLKEISTEYNELNRATNILLERVEKDDALKKNLENELRKLQSTQGDVGALQNGVTESLIESISKIMRKTGMYAHQDSLTNKWEFYIEPVKVDGVIRDKIDMIGKGMETTRKELVQKMEALGLYAAYVRDDKTMTISVVDEKTIDEGNETETFLKSLREQLVPSSAQSSYSSNTGDEDDKGIKPTEKTYREVLEMYIKQSTMDDIDKKNILRWLRQSSNLLDLAPKSGATLTRGKETIRDFLIKTVDADAEGSDLNTFTTSFKDVQLNDKVVFANGCFNIQTYKRNLVPLVGAPMTLTVSTDS